ncbi:MAG: hypothetical protein RIR60_475 [Pseudomonadota bacterium]
MMLGFLVRLAISFHQAVTIRLPSNKMVPKICSDLKNKYESVIVQSLDKELAAHANKPADEYHWDNAKLQFKNADQGGYG